MSDPVETVRKKGGDLFRELATHQGIAYRSYGEALARYGEGSLKFPDLVKEAGDLYYREAGRIASSLFSAVAEVFAGGVDRARSEVADGPHPDEKTVPVSKPRTSKV
jgi:hypothetical protein